MSSNDITEKHYSRLIKENRQLVEDNRPMAHGGEGT